LRAKPIRQIVPFRQAAIVLACALGLFVAACIVLYPEAAHDSAMRGIAIWWKVLFPALFPFLVISEIMLGFGIVHFLGALLDPMMRPLFRVPGIGGFAMAMGFASGYPVSAKLTSQLREQNLVTRTEGERLVAFSTTSDPLFLIGAVSIGFFHNPGIAAPLAIAHYGSAVLIGVIFRFYGRKEDATHGNIAGTERSSGSGWSGASGSRTGGGDPDRRNPLSRAFAAMHAARLADGRTIGRLLQDSVTNSLPLIMTIGGLVVFFSVLMEMFGITGVLSGLIVLLHAVLDAAGFPPALVQSLVNGLFEVTLGAQAAGTASSQTSLRYSAAAAALILSWAGLSVHAQVLSLISRTDMRYRPFVTARLLHGVLSAALLFVAWPLLAPLASPVSGAWGYADFADGRMFRTLGWSMQSAAVLFFATLALVTLLNLARLLAIRWMRR